LRSDRGWLRLNSRGLRRARCPALIPTLIPALISACR
jgi:hypothetical protein